MSVPAYDITRESHRFVTYVDGHEAVIDFRKSGNVLDAYHTGVPQAIGGRGVAAALVKAMMDDARAQGEQIRPSCSYVAAWLKRHPDYADLSAKATAAPGRP